MDWTCEVCGGKSFARVDEKKSDGKFGPGPDVRCIECKTVSRAPTLPNADELEVRAYEWQSKGPVHFTAEPPPANMPVTSCDALVRRSKAAAALSSTQAQIERLTRERDEALLCQQEIAAGTSQSATVARIIIAKNEAENRADAADAQVKRLRETGNPLATMAFNLSQASSPLTDDHKQTLKAAVDAWDTALSGGNSNG